MESTQTNNIASITYELNDALKDLACREIRGNARVYEFGHNDASNYDMMSGRTEYSYYHTILDKHLNRKSSSEMDYFAFTILLTYTPEIINTFHSWRDLKMYVDDSNDETDFDLVDVYVSSSGDDGPSNYTCVCSHHIKNIFKLTNKHSMTSFQVGSECIKRAGLVSSENLKIHKKLMDAKIERQKEIDEGKPLGYYEELRKNKKDEKDRARQLKIEERDRAKQLKIEEKETRQLNQLMCKGRACSKKCIMCNAVRLFKSDDSLRICNKCVKNAPKFGKKKWVDSLKNPKNYKQDNCNECAKLFAYCCTTVDEYLCNKCKDTHKITQCKLCSNLFVNVKTNNDETCDECDSKLKSCVVCENTFIPKIDSNIRCNLCQTRIDNKIIVIKCSDCNINVEIKENDKKWRKNCSACYKKNLESIDCSVCQEPVRRHPTEHWKTVCKVCYHLA